MSAIGVGQAAARATLQTLDTAPPSFLGRVVHYIPADIVAAYVAVFALLGSSDKKFTDEWVVAAAFLVLTPFVVITAFVGQTRKDQGHAPKVSEWPWFQVCASIVAYCAWVFALPQTPARQWGSVTGWLQTFVLAVVTLLLGGFAQALGK